MYQVYFIWNHTLHVSDGLSIHHQEFKTVHTAVSVCLLYVQSWTPDDGWKDRPKHVEGYLVLSPTYALIYIIKILSQAITLVALLTPTCFDPYGSSSGSTAGPC